MKRDTKNLTLLIINILLWWGLLLYMTSGVNAQVSIENRTEHECAKPLAEIIARDILDLDTLNMIIVSLPSSSTLEGAVVKNKIDPHTYTLLLNQALSVKRLRLTMSHEMVHVKQYEHEGLEIFGDIWSWSGDWGSMTFTEYHHRTFEVDAGIRELEVNKELNRIIKSKRK